MKYYCIYELKDFGINVAVYNTREEADLFISFYRNCSVVKFLYCIVGYELDIINL